MQKNLLSEQAAASVWLRRLYGHFTSTNMYGLVTRRTINTTIRGCTKKRVTSAYIKSVLAYCQPAMTMILLVLSVDLNGQSPILHSLFYSRIKWRGLRSRKTCASGCISGLRWYISPSRKAVTQYFRMEYHFSEGCCSLVIRSISQALSCDTCRLDSNSVTDCSSCH